MLGTLILIIVNNLDFFSLFALPYRLIYAVATQNAIMFYDTQQVFKYLNRKQKLACLFVYPNYKKKWKKDLHKIF